MSVSKELFSYQTLVHAIAGSVGSVVGMATFFPLDTVRSRLQLEDKRKSRAAPVVMQELIQEEGFSTLYRGMVPVLKSLWVSNFVYFYTFHGLKKLKGEEGRTAGRDLLLASLAGVVNVLTTTPLWVVNTRLKMAGVSSRDKLQYSGLIDGLVHIAKIEGIEALWNGTLPSLMLVINPALQMSVYEAIKRGLKDRIKLGVISYFLIAAMAKTVSTTLTYPLQLIQTKLRHGHSYRDLAPNAGMLDLTIYILKKQGFLGLYKGMEAKILQTVMTSALMFAVYEKIAQLVFKVLLKNKKSLS